MASLSRSCTPLSEGEELAFCSAPIVYSLKTEIERVFGERVCALHESIMSFHEGVLCSKHMEERESTGIESQSSIVNLGQGSNSNSNSAVTSCCGGCINDVIKQWGRQFIEEVSYRLVDVVISGECMRNYESVIEAKKVCGISFLLCVFINCYMLLCVLSAKGYVVVCSILRLQTLGLPNASLLLGIDHWKQLQHRIQRVAATASTLSTSQQ